MQFNQLNVQTPTIEGAGPVSVVVITNCDTPDEQQSAPEIVQLMDRTPAFFLLEPILNAAGDNPVAASHADFTKVGDPETHPGTTPAEPGEFIILWGTGFGLTDPALQAGQIPENVLPDFGLADIAAEAKLPFAEMYRHCPSKPAILDALARQTDATVLTGLTGESDEDAHDRHR